MNIKEFTPDEAIARVTNLEDIGIVRSVASQLGITYSGNSGIDTLKGKIIDALSIVTVGGGSNEEVKSPSEALDEILNPKTPLPEPVIVVPPKKLGDSIEELLAMDPNKITDPTLCRKVVRAQALRLVRVKIQNLDPSDSMLTGDIITVVNKYTGKVSKFIPYGDQSENGYHVPQILLDELRQRKYPLRREVPTKRVGVKSYKTSLVPKFSITVLPLLTSEELNELKLRQNSSA